MIEKEDVINSAYLYTYNLIDGINQLITLINEGDFKRVSSLIIEISEGIEWLLQALTIIQDVLTTRLNLEAISQCLSELLTSLENKDYVLIADLFHYEIIPIIQDWQSAISGTINKVQ